MPVGSCRRVLAGDDRRGQQEQSQYLRGCGCAVEQGRGAFGRRRKTTNPSRQPSGSSEVDKTCRGSKVGRTLILTVPRKSIRSCKTRQATETSRRCGCRTRSWLFMNDPADHDNPDAKVVGSGRSVNGPHAVTPGSRPPGGVGSLIGTRDLQLGADGQDLRIARARCDWPRRFPSPARPSRGSAPPTRPTSRRR